MVVADNCPCLVVKPVHIAGTYGQAEKVVGELLEFRIAEIFNILFKVFIFELIPAENSTDIIRFAAGTFFVGKKSG